MEKDILSVISDQSKRFSKGQRHIANYITENYDKAAFMNAVKLGNTVGVSESTVVRFASMLGYDGYPGMRKALQEMIRNRLTAVQRMEVAKDMMGSQDVLHGVLSADMEKIRTTLEEVDNDAFDRTIEAICGAERIYILGLRASACLSSFMGFYLNFMFENVRIVNDTYVNEPFEQIMNISEKDVFLAISYPRYSRRTVKAMRYAKAQGAKTIAMTDGQASPIAGIADISLFARSDMVSFLDSLVAPLSLINALMVALGTRAENEKTLTHTFERLEHIWTEYDVYEKSNDPSEGRAHE